MTHQVGMNAIAENQNDQSIKELVFGLSLGKKMDAYHLNGLSNEDMVFLIYESIGIDLYSSDGMNRINELLHRSISFYENVLHKKYPKTSKRNFNTPKDVIDFFRKNKSSPIQQVHCAIAKVGLAVNSIMMDYSRDDVAKIAEDFLQESFLPNVVITGDRTFPFHTSRTEGVYVKDMGEPEHEFKPVKFFVSYRAKQDDKAILKLLYNKGYESSHDLKDPIGIRLETDSEENVIYLLELMYGLMSERMKPIIKDKNLLSETLINSQMEFVSPEFLQRLVSEINPNTRKAITAGKYRDMNYHGLKPRGFVS